MISFELLSINLYIDLFNYLHLGHSLEHWWELLQEENKYAKTKYKAPKEFNDFLAFLHLFLPYRAIEGVLSTLAEMKIIPTSLD